MRACERLPVQSIQRKQHVTRDNELRRAIPTCGVRSERVVARHVRMYDFDFMLTNEPRQLMRALHVECIAQRQRFYLRLCELHVLDEWRVRPYCKEEIVAACIERVREVGQVSLAAAER